MLALRLRLVSCKRTFKRPLKNLPKQFKKQPQSQQFYVLCSLVFLFLIFLMVPAFDPNSPCRLPDKLTGGFGKWERTAFEANGMRSTPASLSLSLAYVDTYIYWVNDSDTKCIVKSFARRIVILNESLLETNKLLAIKFVQ